MVWYLLNVNYSPEPCKRMSGKSAEHNWTESWTAKVTIGKFYYWILDIFDSQISKFYFPFSGKLKFTEEELHFTSKLTICYHNVFLPP